VPGHPLALLHMEKETLKHSEIADWMESF